MHRPQLVLRENEWTSFTSFYLEDIWRQFFEITMFDHTSCYDLDRTLFVVSNLSLPDDPWPADMRSRGCKVVIDNLWERCTGRSDYFWLEHEHFMWWNESLWWRALGYHDYRPNKNTTHLAFMPVRGQKPERDQAIDFLQPWLHDMIWSYQARGQSLPDDDREVDHHQRYMHASWYDCTFCSLVIETYQTLPLYVSEKSYKPLAYFHPYLILSAPGTLQFLRDLGFETFENIFDESYDRLQDLHARLTAIAANLSTIDISKNYDRLTMEKLEHNHARFFDQDLVTQQLTKHVIEPLLTYAET